MPDRKVEKVADLLEQQKTAVIEQLGPRAFEILTPYETAQVIGIDVKRLPDLIREGWLEPVPGKDIGRAHQYYRWRATFVHQLRKTRHKEDTSPA